ncbi:MAG: hypothetical protein PUF09_08120, partial [Bacteroidales bacterium]|nr:hypothetical protein [Bacteroidales bacterium]
RPRVTRPAPAGHATCARGSRDLRPRVAGYLPKKNGKTLGKNGKTLGKKRGKPKAIPETDIASIPRPWNAGNVHQKNVQRNGD